MLQGAVKIHVAMVGDVVNLQTVVVPLFVVDAKQDLGEDSVKTVSFQWFLSS